MADTSYCSVGNLTCNFDQGTPNIYRGVISYQYYGYNVYWGSAISFLTLFSISAVLHIGQGFLSRQSWTLVTFGLGTICEVIGWGGRMLSRTSTTWLPDAGGYWSSPFSGYVMQLCCLIIAPAFLAAGDYILLGRIMQILGPEYSWVHPTSYGIVCVVGDIISLVVQAVGGALAAIATDTHGQELGARVMVGGVFWQLVVMCFYTSILLSYIVRLFRRKPFAKQFEFFAWWPQSLRRKARRRSAGFVESEEYEISSPGDQTQLTTRIKSLEVAGLDRREKEVRNANVMLLVCCVTTLLIFIRSIYRSIELLDGWTGAIIQNQPLFDGMDGGLMLTVCFIFNVMHPMFWLSALRKKS